MVAQTSQTNLSPLEQIARGVSIPGKSQLKSAADQSLALVTQLSEKKSPCTCRIFIICR